MLIQSLKLNEFLIVHKKTIENCHDCVSKLIPKIIRKAGLIISLLILLPDKYNKNYKSKKQQKN